MRLRIFAATMLFILLSISEAHTQVPGSQGPILTARINNTFFVGSGGYTTIQKAVTAACANVAGGIVTINPGATPSDLPTAVSGCNKVSICDESVVPAASYKWVTSAYVLQSSGGGGNGGVTITPAIGGVWQHEGTIIAPTQAEQYNATEPTLLYEGGAHVLTGTSGNIFKLWWTCGWDTTGLCYAESVDGEIWQRATSPVVPRVYGGPTHGFVFHYGSTYYYYAAFPDVPAATQYDRYESPDGVNWTLTHANVMGGGSGTWDDGGLGNIYVIPSSGIWLMMYEAGGGGKGAFSMGVASSADQGVTWTKYSGNPVITLGGGNEEAGGPDIHVINGIYYVWGQCSTGGNVYPDDICRWHSPTFLSNSWVIDNGGNPTFTRASVDEGSGNPIGQVADPSMVQVGNTIYMAYEGVMAQNGSTPGAFHMKMATAPLTFDQLVQTNEGNATSMHGSGGFNSLNLFGVQGGGNQCLHADNSGTVTGTGSDCGSGTGSAASIAIDKVFTAAGTINYPHNLGTPNPLYSCLVNSGSTAFTVAKVDNNNLALTTSAASDITCSFQYVAAAAAAGGLTDSWLMHEGSGTTLNDSIGAVNLTTQGVTWVSGKATFSGASGASAAKASTVGTPVLATGSPFSISFWVTLSTIPSTQVGLVANMVVTPSTPGVEIITPGTGALGAIDFVLNNDAATNALLVRAPAGTLVAGTLAHVVCTYDGTHLPSGTAIYVNGVAQTLTTFNNNLTGAITPVSPFTLMANPTPGGGTTNNAIGTMQAVRVYNRVLPPSEISTLFSAGPQ